MANQKYIKLTTKELNVVENLVNIHGSTRRNAIKLVVRRRRRRHTPMQRHGSIHRAQAYIMT